MIEAEAMKTLAEEDPAAIETVATQQMEEDEADDYETTGLMGESGLAMNAYQNGGSMQGSRAKKQFAVHPEDGVRMSEEERIKEGLNSFGWVTGHFNLITVFLGTIIGTLMNLIVLKLNLTVGVIPSLNVPAALMGFMILKSLTKTIVQLFEAPLKATVQQITVLQTFAVAQGLMAFYLGYGGYYTALDMTSALVSNGCPLNVTIDMNASQVPAECNIAEVQREYEEGQIIQPVYGKLIATGVVTCFGGLFLLVKLRYLMIAKLGLVYPSGTASAELAKGLFADGQIAMKKFYAFVTTFCYSFGWTFVMWLFGGEGDGKFCGLDMAPNLGWGALAKHGVNWDFDVTYVGTGMLCSHHVNYSMLIGGLFSYFWLWPYVLHQCSHVDGEGWFNCSEPRSSLQGLRGYQVFASIGCILGDSFYQMGKIAIVSYFDYKKRSNRTAEENLGVDKLGSEELREKRILDEIFKYDPLPIKVPIGWGKNIYLGSIVGYLMAVLIGVLGLHFMYGIVWWHILILFCIVPLYVLPNSYICGLCDWDLTSTFAKLIIIIFAALGGQEMGILNGLVLCGISYIATGQSCGLMQDFKTAYLTGTSPASMFAAQLFGAAMGCITAPACYMLFYSAFTVGDPNGPYPAPYASAYRQIAMVGAYGFDTLPEHALEFAWAFFVAAFLMAVLRDLITIIPTDKGSRADTIKEFVNFILPMPACFSISFYVGPQFTYGSALGSIFRFFWQRGDKAYMKKHGHQRERAYAVFGNSNAAGWIAGSGLFTIPQAVFSIAGILPPFVTCFTRG